MSGAGGRGRGRGKLEAATCRIDRLWGSASAAAATALEATATTKARWQKAFWQFAFKRFSLLFLPPLFRFVQEAWPARLG